MSDIPKKITDLLDKHGLYTKDAAWELPQKKGTWILKHKTLEALASAMKISFENPEFIDANPENVVLVVRGKIGDVQEWSIGESSTKNNKNQYPYAMAEKRAKDRVILKLAGLHGDAYSEEEADDFKQSPIADAGYDNAAARNEVARLLEVVFDNWTPAMCELDFLRKVGRRLAKSEPQLTAQYTERFATLAQLEKDFEKEGEHD